jgi:ankyrin repeat protein
MFASMYGLIDIVRLLVAAGADKRGTDNKGRTAHDMAQGTKAAAAIRALLDAAP